MLKYIHCAEAPKAIGAYHPAVQAGQLVFISGQLGLDPKTGAMISSDFGRQTHQVFKNLKAVCQAAGGDLTNLAKVNVFLTDMAYFAEFNQIMMGYFSEQHYPARSAIACLALPKNALVEVEGMMYL
jgi:reactive intermediate/imine deaminase